MSTTTTNLGLIKPEATDNVSLSDYNFNLDTIDTAIHKAKDIMTVSVNSNNMPLSKEGLINCNYVLSSTGSSLSQGNNGIVIGAGVSKVKVSCNFWINAMGENRVWVNLTHRKKTVINRIGDVISIDKSGFVTGSISPVLVDVTQGDYFYLSYENAVSGLALNSASGNAHATNITVEVVE